MRRSALAVLALLAASTQPIAAERTHPFLPGIQPVAPHLGAGLPAGHTTYSNDSLADLFVRLTHDLEWGASRPHLVRLEEPISVGVVGAGAERYLGFLDGYLAELRAQAGIDIARAATPRDNLTIIFVPGPAFRARVPRHYCVIAPKAVDWDTFRGSPRRHGTRPFETQTAIAAATVFIPDNAEPFLVRACLIEEIAQALGPANDLYGLGSSIFNDDAAHIWPTRIDFLMLSVLYAPEMRTGLDRGETRERALLALGRLNPDGRGAPGLPALRTEEMVDWTARMRAAFDRSRPIRRRLASAREALAIAADRAPFSAYHCRSLIVLGRAAGAYLPDDPSVALSALDDAARVCAMVHGPDDIRIAQIRLEQARLYYRSGRASAAYGLSEGLEDRFAAYGQEERLTALYVLQAASLGAIQQTAHSTEARRRAGEWGAFALGRDHAEVRNGRAIEEHAWPSH